MDLQYAMRRAPVKVTQKSACTLQTGAASSIKRKTQQHLLRPCNQLASRPRGLQLCCADGLLRDARPWHLLQTLSLPQSMLQSHLPEQCLANQWPGKAGPGHCQGCLSDVARAHSHSLINARFRQIHSSLPEAGLPSDLAGMLPWLGGMDQRSS